jgi:DNA-binding response OmpR family regulator
MILFVSSQAREAEVFASLCAQRDWVSCSCKKLSEFVRIVGKSAPRVVVTRQRLEDGYADDILSYFRQPANGSSSRVLILAAANCAPKEEARLLSLGAEQIFRDPVRVGVLLEVISRYQRNPISPPETDHADELTYYFAGARVFRSEHRLACKGRVVTTTPKVIELIDALRRTPGRVVSYMALYDELFARRFDGDTSNCRVLLAKAAADFERVGLDLRTHIEVIPKSGYRYNAGK